MLTSPRKRLIILNNHKITRFKVIYTRKKKRLNIQKELTKLGVALLIKLIMEQ